MKKFELSYKYNGGYYPSEFVQGHGHKWKAHHEHDNRDYTPIVVTIDESKDWSDSVIGFINGYPVSIALMRPEPCVEGEFSRCFSPGNWTEESYLSISTLVTTRQQGWKTYTQQFHTLQQGMVWIDGVDIYESSLSQFNSQEFYTLEKGLCLHFKNGIYSSVIDKVNPLCLYIDKNGKT